MTMSPSYFCRRSMSAAANPAPPPPTITILFGASDLTWAFCAWLSALFPHEDFAVELLDQPRIDRTEGRRAQSFAGTKVEAGVMPGTTHRVVDNEPVRQGAADSGCSGRR